MIRQTLTSLSSIAGIGADTIIDVRAPLEFAEDHIPGAINLPVLSDDERARLLEIADKCPVHRTLERTSKVKTELMP